jgi:hypothetical protein
MKRICQAKVGRIVESGASVTTWVTSHRETTTHFFLQMLFLNKSKASTLNIVVHTLISPLSPKLLGESYSVPLHVCPSPPPTS